MHSNRYIITFVITICFICALILSLLATLLKKPQANARELYRNRQLLTAAQIPNLNTNAEIMAYYNKNVTPVLVDKDGKTFTFEEKKINYTKYIDDNEKKGFANLPLKLVYKMPDAYVFPVSGSGLWDMMYGFLAIKPDGDTVIGATWYDQKETPGLGGDIATPKWLSQFPGKKIFHEPDYKTAGIGITVSKSPTTDYEVHAITGATITGNAVSEAYRKSLAPYRTFLIKLSEGNGK